MYTKTVVAKKKTKRKNTDIAERGESPGGQVVGGGSQHTTRKNAAMKERQNNKHKRVCGTITHARTHAQLVFSAVMSGR